MNKIEIFLRSKATRSLVGIFVVQGLTAIVPSLHGTVAQVVQGILALLTIYLHSAEIQMAGQTGRLGSKSI